MTIAGIRKWVKKKSTVEHPTVPGYGSERAKIALVGECPGHQEVLEQKPFVGRTGKILRRALREAGFTEKEIENDVYFTNAIKEWLPIGKIPPTYKIIYWRRMLTLELGIIKPKLIVAVGRTAARSLGRKANLVVPHPGSVRFNKDNYGKLVDAFKEVRKLVNKNVSES